MFGLSGYGILILAGFITYKALGGESPEPEKKEDNYEEETFIYFMHLPLEEQERYFKENLDLKFYKDDNALGLTNDRYLNAKHAREISRITGKRFTNKDRVY